MEQDLVRSHRSAPARVFEYVAKRARQKVLLSKWKKNEVSRTFDWDWEKIHFNRIALVSLLCANKFDGNYLEIGCQGNKLFDSVPMKHKIGVDPEAGGTLRMTSDDFFAKNQTKFDVIFIDGLHTYEQVRKDIINSIKYLKDGGWIALHDMLPRTWVEEHVPRLSLGVWTGDVWKAAFELAATKEVDFKIIKIDCGVGLFRIASPQPNLVDLSKELEGKRFSYFYDNINRIPLTDWESAMKWIGPAGR